jgi:ApbE superfamily uncharacterized protein (UPF0280 family)
MYEQGREGFLDGSIDWDTDDIRTTLVDTGTYTVNLTTHKFLSAIAPSVLVATMNSGMAGKTVTFGVADANDVTFTAVSGTSVEALVLYKWSGTDAGSRLIAYIDTATGLPVTPNGGDITVQWDSGANRIFKL